VHRHESGSAQEDSAQLEFAFGFLESTRYKTTVPERDPTKNVPFLSGPWRSLNLPLVCAPLRCDDQDEHPVEEAELKALLDRARTFTQRVEGERGEYRKLAEGQYPEALFITCSDSRVMPALITDARPGEIFELRNAGNIVPPYGRHGASGEAATLEYALEVLGVQDIVVCGHSHCGAMGALKSGDDLTALPGVDAWLNLARPELAPVLTDDPVGTSYDPSLPDVAQRNVVNQLAAVRSYPSVRQRLEEDRVRLHGWYYEIDTGRVYELDDDGRFRVHVG
jgi:carbonic anhydrase